MCLKGDLNMILSESMDVLVPKSYRRYGTYVNRFRAFALKEDGLKPVERRLLLTSHLIAKEKYVKSARVTGTCMAKFHPHSDAYGTLVQLANQGFIDGQGNWGNSLGVDPTDAAASRYTECRISKFVEDTAFQLIKYVDWVESELDDEPESLPTMFPFCLMGNDYTQGIGFGYRTLIPCYSIQDLQKRLMWLLGDRKEEDKPIIKPKTNCKILSDNTVMEELLTTGKSKVDFAGIMTTNKVACKAIVKSWPPGKRFEAIMNRIHIKSYFDSQDVGFIDSSSGENGTSVIFSVLRQRNKDKIFASFVKNLQEALTGSVTFENVTVDLDGNVKLTSVDEMLLTAYKRFLEFNKIMLQSKIDKNNESLMEYSYLKLIREPLADILKEGNINIDFDTKLERISNKINLPIEIIRELFSKYNIRKLLTFELDEKEIELKNVELAEKLNNIDSFVLTQYQEVV